MKPKKYVNLPKGMLLLEPNLVLPDPNQKGRTKVFSLFTHARTDQHYLLDRGTGIIYDYNKWKDKISYNPQN